MNDAVNIHEETLPVAAVLDLVVDLWRIRRRASRDASTPEPILVACDRAMETLGSIGFEINELVGEAYDQNMLVQVIHEEGGLENRVISECLSPAVYFRKRLIKRAEVVVKGEVCDENTDN
jgi:hypothetical protein